MCRIRFRITEGMTAVERLLALAIVGIVFVGGCQTPAKPRRASTTNNQHGPSVPPVTPALHGGDPIASHPSGSPPRPAANQFPVIPAAFPQPPGSPTGPSTHSSHYVAPANGAARSGLILAGLSLAELEGMALANNPALAVAAAGVEAARGHWVQEGLPPNARIGYAGEELGDEGTAGQQGGFVAQEFVTGGKLRMNRQVAGWQVQRAERELAATRLRVLTDVRIAYYNVMVAQQRKKWANELVDISQRSVEAVEALFRGGQVSEADPLRAEVDAETARIFYQTSESQHVESWRTLAAAIGMPELALQELPGELTAADAELTWQQTLEQLLRESPEIAAAWADVERSRWALRRAYAERMPNLDVNVGVAENKVNGDTLTSVTAEIPLPLVNRNQGGIRRARAEAIAAGREVDRLTLDLQTRLAAAFRRYESARNKTERFSRRGGILDNADRTRVLIRAGMLAEQFGVLDLLSAQRTYFQAKLAYLDALGELWIAIAEIRGMLLSGSLSSGREP